MDSLQTSAKPTDADLMAAGHGGSYAIDKGGKVTRTEGTAPGVVSRKGEGVTLTKPAPSADQVAAPAADVAKK